MLAGGVPPWAVSPLVVFPPAVFGGCAPSGSFVARGCYLSVMSLGLDVSGAPVPGRPPGHQHGCGAWPAAAGQCSKQCVHGLPTSRAGSEYDDLHAHGADRYAPTDLRAFAARVDLITASEY